MLNSNGVSFSDFFMIGNLMWTTNCLHKIALLRAIYRLALTRNEPDLLLHGHGISTLLVFFSLRRFFRGDILSHNNIKTRPNLFTRLYFRSL